LKTCEFGDKLYETIVSERNKDNKPYNYDGAFISLYLQNIENSLLMTAIDVFDELDF